MRALLLIVLLAPFAQEAVAQAPVTRPVAHTTTSPFILDVVQAAGLPANDFARLFGRSTLASFHYGSRYDITYWIAGEGLLTVAFFDGKAGFFRLITRQGRPSPESLPRLLGIDPSGLELVEERDVKKVWRGRVGGVNLVEVCAITSPEGWTLAEITVAGFPND